MAQDIFDELDAPQASGAPKPDLFDEIAPDENEFIPRLKRGVETGLQDVIGGTAQAAEDILRPAQNPYMERSPEEASADIPSLEADLSRQEKEFGDLYSKPKGFMDLVRTANQDTIGSTDRSLAIQKAKERLQQARERAAGEIPQEPTLGGISRQAGFVSESTPSTKEEIRDRYAPFIQDTRDKEFWNTVADSLGQSIPSTAATVLNQPLGLSLMYAQTYGNAREEFIKAKEEQGVPYTEDEAAEYAMTQANAQTPLELVGDVALAGTIGRSLKGVFGTALSKSKLVDWVKKAAVDLTKSAAGETLITTPGQTIAEQKIAEGAGVRAPMSAGELAGTTFENMKVAGAQSLLMGGGPVAVSGAAQAGKSLLRGTVKEEAQREIIDKADAVAAETEAFAPASAQALRIKAREKAIEAGAKIDETLDAEEQKQKEQALKELQESIANQPSAEEEFAPTPETVAEPIVEQFAPQEQEAPAVLPRTEPVEQTLSSVPSVQEFSESPDAAAPAPIAESEQESARARVEEALVAGETPAPEDVALAEATIEPASSEDVSWKQGVVDATDEGQFQPHNFKVSDAEDVAQVAAGKKPIAIAPANVAENEAAASQAQQAGMNAVREGASIFVFPEGSRPLFERLQELRGWARDNLSKAAPDETYNYHKEVGNILGYPANEVEQFAARERNRKNENPPIQPDQPNVQEGVQEAPPTVAGTPEPAPSPQRVQLRGNPQSFEVVEKIPQTDIELQNGEQYFRVRNERTGEIQDIEQRDIAREIKPKSERVKKAVKKLPSKQRKKAEAATEISTEPDPYQGVPLTNAAPLPSINLPLFNELSELGVFDEGATAATVLQNIADSKSTPDWAKTLSKRLLALGTAMDIQVVNRPDSSWSALYDGQGPTTYINLARRSPGAALSILHEASHNVTLEQIRNPEKLTGEALKAYEDLVAIHAEISALPEFQGEYGTSNVEEMVAEAFSNAGFRKKLDRLQPNQKQTFWQRLVNAIARVLFNKSAAPTSLLHRAIENAFTLAGAPIIEGNNSAAMREYTIGELKSNQSYRDVSDELMGFGRTQSKAYTETSYPYSLSVLVKFPDGGVLRDEIKGMNAPHAMERARRNWPAATDITPTAISEAPNPAPVAAMAESGSWPETLSNPNSSEAAEARALVEATQELESDAEIDDAPLTPEQQQLLQETDTFKPLGLTAIFARQFSNIPGTDFNDRQSEAVQGLVKAAKSYDAAKGVPFPQYASGIIRNHMRDYAKSRKVRSKYVTPDQPVYDEEEADTIVSTAPSPQETTIAENDRKRMLGAARDVLQSVLNQSTPREKGILKSYASGMSLRDIASEAGMSQEGVRKFIKRYRSRIEQLLKTRGIKDISEILTPVEQATEPAVPTRKTTIEDENAFRESTVGRIEGQAEARSEPLYDDDSSPEEIAEAVFASRNMPDLSGEGMVPTTGSEQQEAFRDQIQPFLTGYWPDDAAERIGILKDHRAKWLAQSGIRNFLGRGLVELSEVSDNETSRLRFDGTPYRLEIGGANLISTAGRPDVSEVEAKSSVSQEINEEIIHTAHVAWLQQRWEKEGKPGSLVQYVEKSANDTLRGIIDAASTLPTKDAQKVVNALAGSVKLYVPAFRGMDLRSVSQVMMTATPDQKARFINEFIREVIQLRATDQITETSAVTILEKIGKWVADTLKALRWAARNIDGFGEQFASQIRGAEEILGSTFKPTDQGLIAPMAERPAVEPKALEKDVQALIENKEQGSSDIRDDSPLTPLEEFPDPISTQVMGQEFTVEGRQRLNKAYQQAAVDHAKAIFDEAGLEVVPNEFVDSSGQLRQTWKLKDDFTQEEESGQKLLELLKRELAGQNKEGAPDNSVLIDSIRGSFRESEALSQNLRNQLFSYAQGEASMRGIRLRALAGIGKSVTDVAKHMPVYLNKIYSDAFSGEAIDSVLNKFRKNLQEIFGKEEVDSFVQDEKAFTDTMEKLLQTAKKKNTGSKKGILPTMKDILDDILNTPFYSEEDIYQRFKDRLEKQFGISPEISTKAQKFIKIAFEKKFKRAKERALEKTRKALTPTEKKVIGGEKSPLWQKIVKAANAGLFDAPTVLQNLAEQSGWKIPTAEQIEKMKRLAGEEQKLRNLTEEEKAKYSGDPDALLQAQMDKAAATLNKRAQIKKEMQKEWARFSTPEGSIFTKQGWGPEQRKARAQMINEFSSANLLTTPGFFVKQMIDVATQWTIHAPTRAIASAMVIRQNDLKQGNPTQFWKDTMDALKASSQNQLKATRALASTLKQTLKGKTEARNVDALFSSTSVFDRMEEMADKLWAKGDPYSRGKAISLRILNTLRISYRFAQALDMMQGNQAEAQEMYEQVIEQLRENGLNAAEAKENAGEVIGDVNAEWLDAITRAKNIFDANEIDASPADIQVAAWEIVKSRQYARMASAGLDADANKKYNFLLKNTLGWNESEDGGLGGRVIGAPVKGLRKWGEEIGAPIPFSLFGNAIATAVNRTLSASGAGLFPTAFQGSPWFAGEKNKAQRKAEAAIGATLGATLFGLAMAGVLRVRNGWPEDEDEKQVFEKEGHRPGTVEINLGDGQFVPISLSSGPLGLIRPWLAAAGAIQDEAQKHEKAKARAQGRAERSGSRLEFPELTMTDYLSIAKTAATSAALQGRTSGGLVGQFTDQGALSLKRGAAQSVVPLIPFLPANQQVQRMRGANIDPRKADLSQMLFPTPNSSAQRTNSMGDSVSNPNAVQRVSQILTGGTFPWVVSEQDQMKVKPYNLFYKSGWVPPPLTEGTYRNIGGDYRKLTPDEVSAFYKSYGNAFRADVAKVPDSLSGENLVERLQAAHQRSRDKALRDVGVETD